MPRVKSNVARLKRKNKVMKLAKGYFGGRSKLWKAAKESVERAAKYAYRDRRRKKGEFRRDRKSTRLNSSHGYISYAVFCLKKKKKNKVDGEFPADNPEGDGREAT